EAGLSVQALRMHQTYSLSVLSPRRRERPTVLTPPPPSAPCQRDAIDPSPPVRAARRCGSGSYIAATGNPCSEATFWTNGTGASDGQAFAAHSSHGGDMEGIDLVRAGQHSGGAARGGDREPAALPAPPREGQVPRQLRARVPARGQVRRVGRHRQGLRIQQ